MKRIAAHLGQQGLRLALLVAIIAASGLGLGLAAGYPVSQIKFEESDAIRLDQSRLENEVDPELAVLGELDLPLGWEPADPAVTAFGILGADFCGEQVPLPTALSSVEATAFAEPSDDALVVSQAVRVDRWQSARSYIDDVADAIDGCDRFFRTDVDGQRVQVDIRAGTNDPPITDHVSRTFVAADGRSVQTWSIMAVGDVLIGLLYVGPTRPQQDFLIGLEDSILIRVAPAEFAPGGIAPVVDDPDDATTGTTVLEGGAADESETPGPEEDPGAGTLPPPGEADAPVDGVDSEPPG